jgi:transposase-like protein
MGRQGYPPEFKRKVLDLIEAGRSLTDVARDLGISGQAIYTWRRQDRINRGLLPGLNSAGKEELAVARQRIAQLEMELRATHRAIELVQEVVPPKGATRRYPG